MTNFGPLDMDLLSTDTLTIARSLLGMSISTAFVGLPTAGSISEVEAYLGEDDRASHSFGGKRSKRTETMYGEGGTVYVYLCYGIHEMLNIVCGPIDHPHAILIRGIIPTEGIETMYHRRKKSSLKGLTDGPGKVCQALGIDRKQDGRYLNSGDIRLESGQVVDEADIHIGPRIGVDYAGEDALLPYRFLWTPS